MDLVDHEDINVRIMTVLNAHHWGNHRKANKRAAAELASKPIRTIYVNAAQNYPTARYQVIDQFCHFGEIHSVRLHAQSIYFFITFVNSEDAAKVLQPQAKHYLSRMHGYRVNAAEEWHQPIQLSTGQIIWDRRKMNSEPAEPTIREDPTKAENLLDLPDDCLLQILSHLSFRNLLQIESVSKRMRTLSQMSWSRLNRLHSSSLFPLKLQRLEDWRAVLERAGSSIRTIELTDDNHPRLNITRILSLVAKLCPNLSEMVLTFHKVSDALIRALLPLNDRLETLTVLNLGIVLGPTDPLLSVMLSQLTNIKTLKIIIPPSRGPNVLCLGDNVYTNITNLNIFDVEIASEEIKKFFPNLETLNCGNFTVDGSSKLEAMKSLTMIQKEDFKPDPDFFAHLHSVIPNVEYLAVSNRDHETQYDFNQLEKFKKLNCLFLRHFDLTNDTLATITRVLPRPLLEFSCHKAAQVTMPGVISFIQSHHDLRLLDVSGCDMDATVLSTKLEPLVAGRTNKLVILVQFKDLLDEDPPNPSELCLIVDGEDEMLDCRLCIEDDDEDLDSDGDDYEHEWGVDPWGFDDSDDEEDYDFEDFYNRYCDEDVLGDLWF